MIEELKTITMKNETITLCIDCGEPTQEKASYSEHDWESLTWCPTCETLEPETFEMDYDKWEES